MPSSSFALVSTACSALLAYFAQEVFKQQPGPHSMKTLPIPNHLPSDRATSVALENANYPVNYGSQKHPTVI